MSRPFKTILLVEDDSSYRMALEMALADDGRFEVIPTDRADEAINVLALRPDVNLVLTDQSMPGIMDGFGLAHHVASNWPEMPIILMSGRSPHGPLPDGTKFVPKPTPNHALIGLINDMLMPRRSPPFVPDLRD